ncbi:MAG: hypothetical protein MPJ06_04570 [Nitrosopumilus sp.]|nr:hypothetical protein [Nitrosopumilus sp.]MDA7943266.1 hypothetical protein [Nitrosopumilus sp.]MDA7998249.1 hypothetical protein [Nitrosopumilus sp.]MDA7998646.1 hypothetical protein [Nitrosopumilus sp.]
MDAALEEELVDLMSYCLQNPGAEVHDEERRITEIGRVLHEDGGTDAMDMVYHAVRSRLLGEIEKDVDVLAPLWNGIGEWKR